MLPRDHNVVSHVNWDSSGAPLVRDWFAWLEVVTPVICAISGELP